LRRERKKSALKKKKGGTFNDGQISGFAPIDNEAQTTRHGLALHDLHGHRTEMVCFSLDRERQKIDTLLGFMNLLIIERKKKKNPNTLLASECMMPQQPGPVKVAGRSLWQQD
jgi:hypothetical protein